MENNKISIILKINMRIISILLFLSIFSNVDEKVTATVYNAVPAQTNSDPGHTASMFKLDLSNPYKHRIIAVSRDLLIKFPMGTKVRVSGTKYDGVYVVEDKMNKRYKKRIDILINVDMKIGKWDNVVITKI
jgi:3D (Asp-Asp-Asp) domain-containing protein